MTYDVLGPMALDYLPCRYGTSKLTFRGPRRDLGRPNITFIGGTQTFGKFVAQPYPLRVEHLAGVPCVNFGQPNAGVDVFAKEPLVLETSRAARATVVEVLGAVNMSNLFYTVHPRRNDRFVRASERLRLLYPEVDFSGFNFTQHMVQHLHRTDASRFAAVQSMLQRTWVRRMRHLLARLGPQVVLLRFCAQDDREGAAPWDGSFGPAFVTDAMLDRLAVSDLVQVPFLRDRGTASLEGKVFGATEMEAARAVPPVQSHSDAARALLPVLDRLM